MKEECWAKSNGTTLTQHVRDVLGAIEAVYVRYKEKIKEEWWLALRYAALLHDLGKIDLAFQKMLKRSQKMIQNDIVETGIEIPHNFLSLFLFKPEKIPCDSMAVATIISSVVFHHWRENYPDFLIGNRSRDIRAKASEVFEKKDIWSEMCEQLQELLRDVAFYYHLECKEVIDFNEQLAEYLQFNDLGAAGLVVPPYTLTFLPSKSKSGQWENESEKMRIFVAGNLMRADHFASLVETSSDGIKIKDIEQGAGLDFNTLAARIKKAVNKEELWQESFFKMTEYQGRQGEDMILVAPTGFGKTEFAYLWGAGKKNIMLLPMRAATNKIHERTEKIYGQDQAALLHGDAALELHVRAKQHEIDTENEGEQRKAIDMARYLAKPYIVATADQIAPAALRYPGYERIFAVLMNGALVIDEVQAYDPQAAAIITHLIQQNNFLGGKTLLMTATLPSFICREIERRVGLTKGQIVNLLDLPGFREVASSARHRVQFMLYRESDGYSPVVEKILEEACSGKKVLVIMNTVSAARNIYKSIKNKSDEYSIKNIPIVLLHSRFTFEQRKQIEHDVVERLMPNKQDRSKGPCIVVSTQIVEASLDIDADVLFTEAAPADSLVQRMGRVYRRYARSTGNNAPEQANIIVILQDIGPKKSKKEQNKTNLCSGIGRVYDRNLTAVSLAVLAVALEAGKFEELPLLQKKLEEEPWISCFYKKKGKKKDESANEALIKIIRKVKESNGNLIISEDEKLIWVEQVYSILDKSRKKELSFYISDYLERYYKVLETLDHGYCSDKRQDAMRLFREVNEVSVIPKTFVEEFYQEMKAWVSGKSLNVSYLEMAVNILPRFTVACPYRAVVKEGRLPLKPNIEAMLPEGLTSEEYEKIYRKLSNWLADIFLLDLPYDSETGLNYFDD